MWKLVVDAALAQRTSVRGPSLVEVLLWALGILVTIWLGNQVFVVMPRNRKREREKAEGLAAPPAIDYQPGSIEQLGAVEELVREFVELRTFDAVADWDRRALELAETLEQQAASLMQEISAVRAQLDDYRRDTSDALHVRAARIEGTERPLRRAGDLVAEAGRAYEELMERVDMSPDNKAEQRALLKTLRAAKKELQSEKREARAAMGDIRRQARVATVAATASPWAFTISRKMAAEERRNIRRQKEAALAPHEDAAAAIERQLIVLDRRIAWVQRFGDDEAGA
jgi:hypothetical protein